MTTTQPSDTSLRDGYFATRTVRSLAAQLRRGETSSRELVDRALAEIARLNPALNAFSTVDVVGARGAALAADRELADGNDRGPLHGVPVAIKDIIDVEGQVTTAGSALYAGRVASSDAACVRALREAGAIIVGKTVLHEFAYGATGDRSFHGPSRNPHDLTRISGGSSGGSAVAVASGMVPVSLGTDTAGSVRVPAAICGIVGLKPAFEAISTQGVYPLARSLDHVGIFTQSVLDAQDVHDALAASAPVSQQADRAPRVAWVAPRSVGPVEPEIESIVLDALQRVTGAVPQISLGPAPGALFDHFSTLQASEAYAEHVDDVENGRELIDGEVLGRLSRGADIAAWRYVQSTEVRRAFAEEVEGYFSRFDVLVMPTVPVVATVIDERTHLFDGDPAEVRSALLSFTSPWNLTGSPSISVPVGYVSGLPVGLQLICAPGREQQLMALARTIEAQVEW